VAPWWDASVTERVVRGLVVPAVCLGMAVLVLAPVLGRGFVLTYDMVFAPRQYLLPDSFGLGSALPRSVPADAVVGALTTVVPGDLLQQLVLLGALFLGPLGAARLVPARSLGVRLVAAVTYGWTAYLAERLLIGHWPYLLAYAALPWVVLTARRTPALVLACVPGVLTPSGGILVSVAAVVAGGPRRLRVTVPIAVVLNAPWWVPALLHPGTALSTVDGAAAFAARGENWAGPVVGLLGLGGIWNGEAVPGSRANPLVPVLTVVTIAVAFFGLAELARRWGPLARRLTLLGAAGVLLAALPTVPGGTDLVGWVVAHVPGGGLLRDSQKWVAWWALPLALGVAVAVDVAVGAVATRAGRGLLCAVAAVVPVVVLPDFALGAWGRLDAVRYPADWYAVRDVLEHDPRPGDVLTQPFGAFRRFAWNDDRTQLDPAPRFLPRTTVIDDTLYVGGRAVPGEDPRAAAVRAGRPLAELGIGWVLVEHGTPGRGETGGLVRVYDGEWLDLYRVPGAVAAAPDGPPRAPVVVANAAAGGLILICLLWLALPAGRLASQHRRQGEWTWGNWSA
jgi:hypothetical protein